jgi:4'-phosphopantetheinyl transferase EntD
VDQLGFEPIAIDRKNSGAPVWPSGVTGSISHTDHTALAVVAVSARCTYAEGIGVDLEPDGPLDDPAMLQLICRRDELAEGCDMSLSASLQFGKLIFVIKEAVYKASYAGHRSFVDFHDIRVSVDDRDGTFRAMFTLSTLPDVWKNRLIQGRFAYAEGFVIAIASY